MKGNHKKLLDQFVEMSLDGGFGEEIKSAQEDYNRLPPGIATFLKYVLDFCNENKKLDNETAQMRNLVCQLLIVAYREAKKKNSDTARALVHSFIDDYPGAPGSCLLPRWISLAQASLAFREVAKSNNRLMIWQQATRHFQAYNEFINGLLGYLIACWRCHLGKQFKIATFNMPYGNKVQQFKELTGGNDGVFYIFIRLARPEIRNAIAHETIWLDSKTGTVRFTEGRDVKRESKIDFVEFMALAHAGSHIAQSYLAAIGTIVIMEDGSDISKRFLPEYLVNVYSHTMNQKIT